MKIFHWKYVTVLMLFANPSSGCLFTIYSSREKAPYPGICQDYATNLDLYCTKLSGINNFGYLFKSCS